MRRETSIGQVGDKNLIRSEIIGSDLCTSLILVIFLQPQVQKLNFTLDHSAHLADYANYFNYAN